MIECLPSEARYQYQYYEALDEMNQLRSVLSEQEGTIKALMSDNVELRRVGKQADDVIKALHREAREYKEQSIDIRTICDQMGDALVSVDEQLTMRCSGHVPTKEAIAKWREWKSTKAIPQG